jgi:prevent-host-death family protein
VEWRLYDAKNRFSAVIEAAHRGGPQTVTKRGVATAVVLSIEDYERLRGLEAGAAPTFAEHLLAIPQAADMEQDTDFDRLDIELRDPGF